MSFPAWEAAVFVVPKLIERESSFFITYWSESTVLWEAAVFVVPKPMKKDFVIDCRGYGTIFVVPQPLERASSFWTTYWSES